MRTMNSKMNVSDGQKMSKGCQLLSSDEEESGGDIIGGEGSLKKGPWTSIEDAILVEFVQKHGEGNWGAVPKFTGLARSGKSCRLRWINHLRPELKKGAFSPEEERIVIELHAKMGNKWARIAAKLPGRTDNEIKNYWNTRTRKMQRAEIRQQRLNDKQESPNVNSLMYGANQQSDVSQVVSWDVPDVEFKNLKVTRYGTDIFNNTNSTRSMFEPSAGSLQDQNTMFPITPHKRLQQSDSIYSTLDGGISAAGPGFNPDVDYSYEKIADPPKLSFPSYPNLSSNDQLHGGYLPGSYAGLYDNSSSVPTPWDVKSELPSFQYSETLGIALGTLASPLPSLESVDALIKSPPAVGLGTLASPLPSVESIDTSIQSPPAEQIQSHPVGWRTPASPLPSLESVDTLIKSPPAVGLGTLASPLPSLESIDTSIQSPPAEQIQSYPVGFRTPASPLPSLESVDTLIKSLPAVGLGTLASPLPSVESIDTSIQSPPAEQIQSYPVGWCTPAFPLPSLESVDTLIKSPPAEQPQSYPVGWGAPASPIPSLVSVDTLIQSPPVEQTQSYPVSLEGSGLLDSIIYGSKTKRGGNNNLLQETVDNCMLRSSTLNPCDTEWDEQGDLSSPSTSVPTVHTPISMGSVDETQSVEATKDHAVKPETVFQDPANCFRKKKYLKRMDPERPDALFDLGWFGNHYDDSKDESVLKDDR